MNLKALYWLVYVFAFTVPLSQFVSVRVLVALCILSLFVGKLSERFTTLLKIAPEVLLFLLVLLAGLFYSDDLTAGFRSLETKFSLLGIPIVFSALAGFDKGQSLRVFGSFAMGVFAACVICIVVAMFRFPESGIQIFFFEELTSVLKVQPTYMAYYLIFSISFGLYLMFYQETNLPWWVLALVVIFFFAVLMLTGGRTSFIGLLLVLSFFILKYILEPGSFHKRVVFGISIFMLVGLFAANSMDFLDSQLSFKNDYWERSVLWESAIQANPNPIIGVGNGDYKTVLNEYYNSHGLSMYAVDSYNSHNQFIQLYFTNGLVGLLSLLILLCRPIAKAFRNQDTFGILVLFQFFIYGMTEVFLGRFQGVVFYALIHQVITCRNLSTTAAPKAALG